MIKDKVAIVTGASSGIGYATALALSRSDAKVAAGAKAYGPIGVVAKRDLQKWRRGFYSKT